MVKSFFKVLCKICPVEAKEREEKESIFHSLVYVLAQLVSFYDNQRLELLTTVKFRRISKAVVIRSYFNEKLKPSL
jgi:hypothetical protein